MIASVHVDPRLTVPLAILLAAGLVWFWARLGRPQVPEQRRRVRRLSVFLMLLSLPAFVRGLSYLDREIPAHQPEYLIAWSIALLLALAILLTACVDILVSMRLHRREYEKEIERAGAELREALRRRRENQGCGDSAPGEDGGS